MNLNVFRLITISALFLSGCNLDATSNSSKLLSLSDSQSKSGAPTQTLSPTPSPTVPPSGTDYFQIPANAYVSIDLSQCPLSTATDPTLPGSVGTGTETNPNRNICGGNYWQKWADVNSNGTMDLTQLIANVSSNGFPSAMFTLIHNQYGDILYHIGLSGLNPSFRHFIWDAWISIANVNGMNALEMGLNHSAVGNTVSFLGVQCDFQSDKQWDVHGYSFISAGIWTPTGVACNMNNWQNGQQHHIKLAMHEDSSMYSYVDAIYDATLNSSGVEVPIISALGGMQGTPQTISGFSAGLIINKFQTDGGPNAITSTQYLSRNHIYAW